MNFYPGEADCIIHRVDDEGHTRLEWTRTGEWVRVSTGLVVEWVAEHNELVDLRAATERSTS